MFSSCNLLTPKGHALRFPIMSSARILFSNRLIWGNTAAWLRCTSGRTDNQASDRFILFSFAWPLTLSLSLCPLQSSPRPQMSHRWPSALTSAGMFQDRLGSPVPSAFCLWVRNGGSRVHRGPLSGESCLCPLDLPTWWDRGLSADTAF